MRSESAPNNGTSTIKQATPIDWAMKASNPAIRCPVDVEHEPRWSKLDQAKSEVPSIPVGLMRLDVANLAIIVLELALNKEVRLHWR